jgi:two-component system, response regulator PdtaR
MERYLPPRRRRVLIVDDELMIAIDLQDAMAALGFDICGLASSDAKARSLAMEDQPDLVLMDVCLAGGREGIETAHWLQTVCDASIIFVTASTDEETLERIHARVPGAPVLSKLGYREHLAGAVKSVS